MKKILFLLLFLLFNSQIFAQYEFIEGDNIGVNITANVNSITEIEIKVRGIYFITSETGDGIKIKWQGAKEFQRLDSFIKINPETTFEYGDKILLQAIDTTHNVYIGATRRM